MRAVILSNATGSSLPSLLMTYIVRGCTSIESDAARTRMATFERRSSSRFELFGHRMSDFLNARGERQREKDREKLRRRRANDDEKTYM